MALDDQLVERLRQGAPTLWINRERGSASPDDDRDLDVAGAAVRLECAAPLLRALFPEIGGAPRPIHSSLLPVPAIAASLKETNSGQWFVKTDHQLPVAGSVKARGGFHEVIAFAERLAVELSLMQAGDDLLALADVRARTLFSRYSIVVGSTGNLGMSIGLLSAALGFRAIVHMSNDAKAWKKQRLRDHGVTVIEHAGDYATAVAKGRIEAEADPHAHFVDDEQSRDLFVGYAAAAGELAAQLGAAGRPVDAAHPLFVYIPCGVGGAPGGITYGLRQIFGNHVHCFFAEPVSAPCMLVQMLAGDTPTSIAAFGLDGRTEADGLAVGQASMLVAPLMRGRLSGIYTLSDGQMFGLLEQVHATEALSLEPSAAAGFAGPLMLTRSDAGRLYLSDHGLAAVLPAATHVIWTTGGSLVPEDQLAGFLERGREEQARAGVQALGRGEMDEVGRGNMRAA